MGLEESFFRIMGVSSVGRQDDVVKRQKLVTGLGS